MKNYWLDKKPKVVAITWCPDLGHGRPLEIDTSLGSRFRAWVQNGTLYNFKLSSIISSFVDCELADKEWKVVERCAQEIFSKMKEKVWM